VTLFLLCLALVRADPERAESATNEAKAESEKVTNDSGISQILDVDARSETEHVLRRQGDKLKYTAVAGSLPVKLGDHKGQCSLFFMAYCAEAEDTARPVSFVFNGGPGAASVYLHLGAMGPKVVPFKTGSGLPPISQGLKDNPHSWLWFTDLVFVDPVGTGYSRCSEKEGKKSGKPSEKSLEDRAWGVEEDLEVLARFIRLYLTRENRWLSPKFLVGESYGGLRVAALADRLQSRFGIAADGAVLVSPALEFGLLSGDRYHLLPWIVTVPSFAATARYHGLASGPAPDMQNPRKALMEVERFAVETLLPALADGETDGIADRLAGYIGLPEADVIRLNNRVPTHRFVQQLLEEHRRLISVYDGTWSAVDPHPGSRIPAGQDPLLVSLNSILTPLLNDYIRQTLRFETDIRYRILNEKVARQWNWRSGMNREQGFVGVAEDLKRTVSTNPNLQILVVHGVFDLITPYFGSVLLLRQMAVDPSVASNLSVAVFGGGHMFYTHPEVRQDFFERAKTFFEKAAETNDMSP
jgi:carboxypeptidase C (cathepsin A)